MGVTQQTRQKQGSDSGLLAAGPGLTLVPSLPFTSHDALCNPDPLSPALQAQPEPPCSLKSSEAALPAASPASSQPIARHSTPLQLYENMGWLKPHIWGFNQHVKLLGSVLSTF